MPEITLGKAVFAIGVCVFTAIALYTDIRFKKISNKLNVTSLGVAFLVRTVFYKDLGDAAFYNGILSAAAGFAIGFGVLFVLFVIGGGGGGDVKFMAALGAWIGPRMTIAVLALGAAFVVILTIVIALWSILTRGYSGTQQKYLENEADGDNDRKRKKKNRRSKPLTTEQRKQRRMSATTYHPVPTAGCRLIRRTEHGYWPRLRSRFVSNSPRRGGSPTSGRPPDGRPARSPRRWRCRAP